MSSEDTKQIGTSTDQYDKLDASQPSATTAQSALGAQGLSADFGRTPSASEMWRQIRTRFDETASVSQGLDSPERNYFYRIERGFQFQQQEADTDFVPLHVEPLLDQAADLLERAIRLRSEWDDLAGRAAALSLEMSEYQALDAIHAEEEAAGIYQLDYQATLADSNAEGKYLAKVKRAAEMQSTAETTWDGNKSKGFNAAGTAGWGSGLPAYYIGGGLPAPEYYPYTADGVSKVPLSDHLQRAAEHQWDINHHLTSFTVGAQCKTLEAQVEATTSRLPGLQFRHAWNTKNVSFQRQRTVALRNVQDIKARLVTDEDGLLNHTKRLPALQNRFCSDWRHAQARMLAAVQGLEQVFGYRSPLPTNHLSVDYFDSCLEWCREAIHWLVRYARRDQGTVVTLSLRGLLGETAWRKAIDEGKTSVRLSEQIFAGMQNIRLRGVASCVAFSQGIGGSHCWRIMLRAPKKALMRHIHGQVVEIDQAGLPVCWLGRVRQRDAQREPDLAGMVAWHNASPLGEWELLWNAAPGFTSASSELTDIELDLHLAFRSNSDMSLESQVHK